MKPSKLYLLTWPLIYGGVLVLLLGVSTLSADTSLGWTIIVTGAVATALGVLAVYLRSRVQD